MKKKKHTFNKGITLIALVVTIIVLLILAGVTINLALNNKGLIEKAKITREATETAKLAEEVQIVIGDRTIEKSSKGTNDNPIKTDLENGLKDVAVEKVEGIPDAYYVKRGETEITVYEDGDVLEGRVSFWGGSNDIECPEFQKEGNVWNWYIYTAGQLKFLADFVNNGNSLTAEDGVDLTAYVTNKGYNTEDVTMITEDVTEENVTRVYLMNNLDLGARERTGETKEDKWETEANELKKWTPIGGEYSTEEAEKQFYGIFEGNNYTISGVYVNREEKYNGIFGASNTIQGLTIKNSYIKGEHNTGGIAGWLSSGKIENCHNQKTTVSLKDGDYMRIGGIVGHANGAVKTCSNTGNVYGKRPQYNVSVFASGIAGFAVGDLTECINFGNVDVTGSFVGGIVGST